MKKILLGFGAVAVTLVVLPLFAAFEAHVVNVTATIENALLVHPESLEYGTVFPQEHLDSTFFITFSTSFSATKQTRVGKVDYVIKQKPQCANQAGQLAQVGEDQTGAFVCPLGYTMRSNLCPYLSKHPDNIPATGPNGHNDTDVPAFHDPNATSSYAYGTMVKLPVSGNDTGDLWTVDLAVPCFTGSCSQDWPAFVHSINPNADPNQFMANPADEHKLFGCDLWVEVMKIYH